MGIIADLPAVIAIVIAVLAIVRVVSVQTGRWTRPVPRWLIRIAVLPSGKGRWFAISGQLLLALALLIWATGWLARDHEWSVLLGAPGILCLTAGTALQNHARPGPVAPVYGGSPPVRGH